MLKALIIDDDLDAALALQRLVAEYCSNTISELKIASRLIQIRDAIQEWKPDVLFLELQLQGFSGFDVLDLYGHPSLNVVVATSEPNHALQSFDYNVVHYLIKPILPHKLIEAMNRVITSTQQKSAIYYLRSKARVLQLLEDDIRYLKADGMYTTFYMVDGTMHTSSKPMAHVLRSLTSPTFLRIHHGYTVNMIHFQALDKEKHVLLLAPDALSLPVSVRKLPLVSAYLRGE